MEGNGDKSRFVLGNMATNTLYDCANKKGEFPYNFLPCNIPWSESALSYDLYERNGTIKKDIPLQSRPPLGFREIQPKYNWNFYGPNRGDMLYDIYPPTCPPRK